MEEFLKNFSMAGLISLLKSDSIMGFNLGWLADGLQKIFGVTDEEVAAVDKKISAKKAEKTDDTTKKKPDETIDKTVDPENTNVIPKTDNTSTNSDDATLMDEEKATALFEQDIKTKLKAVADYMDPQDPLSKEINALGYMLFVEKKIPFDDALKTALANPANAISMKKENGELETIGNTINSFNTDTAPQDLIAKYYNLGSAILVIEKEEMKNVNKVEGAVLDVLGGIFSAVSADEKMANNEQAIEFKNKMNDFVIRIKDGDANFTEQDIEAELAKEENQSKLTANSKMSDIIKEGNSITGSDAKAAAMALNIAEKVFVPPPNS